MRLRAALSALGLGVAALGACGHDERLSILADAGAPAGGAGGSDAGAGGSAGSWLESVEALRLFPTSSHPSVSFEDCLFGSPLAFERGASSEIIVAVGERVVGLEPESGAELYSILLPATGAERPFVISTPVLVGHRLVVAYHTTEMPGETHKPGRDVMDPRKSQHVAVVDLEARALDASFPLLTLAATAPAFDAGKTVPFRPDHALQRGALTHVPSASGLGTIVVTFGNGRDLQPWHGWVFELSLDAWQKSGAAAAISLTRVLTPEHDCGPEDESGSRARLCGGGLWAPSGPLLIDADAGPELILSPGNGKLDLPRGDYANTLLRVRPGLPFVPECNNQACSNFDADQPALACIESCTNLFVPRVPPDDPPLRPESGVCDGTSLFQCWEKLDYVGGSTPVVAATPKGTRVLVYPTKEGHVFLVDLAHFGKLYQRKKLVDVCGTKSDGCQADWAGMIVTQPALAQIGAETLLVIPTFMPDTTHESGVFGLALSDGPSGPELEKRWVFPAAGSSAARKRFRWHPSRASVVELAGEQTVWLVEPGTVDQVPGKLLGLRASDGALLIDQPMAGRGFRFVKPLAHRGVLYTPSCNRDQGAGSLEAHRLLPLRTGRTAGSASGFQASTPR
ncbi:MAG: hypothetical protein IPI67_40720 [Myxococcales bacterium]|nr:hypothetical protein [Myxococcales bacterium]